MNAFPWIYLGNATIEGSHGQGWHRSIEPPFPDLPDPVSILEHLDPLVFDTPRVGLLLPDDLMRPLRVELEHRAKASELPMLMKWKLKRYLPYPVEETCVRFVPLQQALRYMTFSLPQPWLDQLFAAFETKGIHCGYIGGLFSTLLERPSLRDGINLAIFPEFYQLVELDAKGAYLDYRTRRLPFDEKGRLDLEDLAETDLAPQLDSSNSRPLRLFNFAPALQTEAERLGQRLACTNRLDPVAPSPLSLFMSSLDLGSK